MNRLAGRERGGPIVPPLRAMILCAIMYDAEVEQSTAAHLVRSKVFGGLGAELLDELRGSRADCDLSGRAAVLLDRLELVSWLGFVREWTRGRVSITR